jgi:hypothetical protein
VQPLWFGGGLVTLFGSSSSSQSSVNVSGTVTFNGTIRTYDPFLFIQGNVSQSALDQLNQRSEVTSVQQTGDGIIISVDTRDDVYPLAAFLRSINLSAYSRANVVVPRYLEVELITGTVNATLPTGVIQIICEPLVDADNEVPIKMVAVVSNNQIVGYQSAEMLVSATTLSLDAQVDSLNQTLYTYTIPWENRNSLEDLSSYSIDYKKVDSILFSQPLSVTQIIAKKQLYFITYIDTNSAQVVSSFDNVTELNEAFVDVSFTLPSSTLTIVSNEQPDLNYAASVVYTYLISVNSTSISDSFLVDSEEQYDTGENLTINLEVLSVGDKIIEIKRVFLPS